MTTLEWLEQQVQGAERYVRQLRCATGAEWDTLRKGYGLPPSPVAPGLPVPEAEVCEVLTALRRYAEYQLTQLPPGREDPSRLQAFRTRIAELGQPPPLAPPAPADAPPRTGGLLGGIFANAAQGKNWEDGGGRSHHLTLRCPHCGAQQERPVDFRCRYCRGSLVDPGAEPR